jgi:hypothetical protein
VNARARRNQNNFKMHAIFPAHAISPRTGARSSMQPRFLSSPASHFLPFAIVLTWPPWSAHFKAVLLPVPLTPLRSKTCARELSQLRAEYGELWEERCRMATFTAVEPFYDGIHGLPLAWHPRSLSFQGLTVWALHGRNGVLIGRTI